MRLPGFTAEHSFGRSRRVYRATSIHAAPGAQAVRPSFEDDPGDEGDLDSTLAEDEGGDDAGDDLDMGSDVVVDESTEEEA